MVFLFIQRIFVVNVFLILLLFSFFNFEICKFIFCNNAMQKKLEATARNGTLLVLELSASFEPKVMSLHWQK
jgi:hypothetical protein